MLSKPHLVIIFSKHISHLCWLNNMLVICDFEITRVKTSIMIDEHIVVWLFEILKRKLLFNYKVLYCYFCWLNCTCASHLISSSSCLARFIILVFMIGLHLSLVHSDRLQAHISNLENLVVRSRFRVYLLTKLRCALLVSHKSQVRHQFEFKLELIFVCTPKLYSSSSLSSLSHVRVWARLSKACF